MQGTPYPRGVPPSLRTASKLVADATFALAEYAQDPDVRYGDVHLDAIQGGLDLVGYAVDSIVDQFRD